MMFFYQWVLPPVMLLGGIAIGALVCFQWLQQEAADRGIKIHFKRLR